MIRTHDPSRRAAVDRAATGTRISLSNKVRQTAQLSVLAIEMYKKAQDSE
jgi:hypothetical protein